MRKLILFLSLLPLLPLLALAGQNHLDKEEPVAEARDKEHEYNAANLTRELEKIHKKGNINGFAVSICDQNGTLYQNGIGFANISEGESYTSTTIQNIASVSKTFIGVALLKAQEQGMLELDDPVNAYLPFKVINPFHPEIPITIRQLATHTSSITDTKYYDRYAYYLYSDAEPDRFDLTKVGERFNAYPDRIPMPDFLENILSKGGQWYRKKNYLKREPGSLFEYSNVGATLAAYVLERATGIPYDEYTTRYILSPLAMSSSGWSLDSINLNDHTTLYTSSESPLPKYSLVTYPDGGLITNVHDLSKYLTELIKGKQGAGTLLNQESYKELFTEQLSESHLPDRDEDDAYDDEYNSGIFMGFTPKGYIGHTGGDPGVASFMFFNPETNLGRILVINTRISSREGAEQFFAIWNTLEKYEALIQ